MRLCGSIIFILFNSLYLRRRDADLSPFYFLRRRDARAANASKLSVAVVGSRLRVCPTGLLATPWRDADLSPFYFLRRRDAKAANASKLSVAVVGSGTGAQFSETVASRA